MTGFFFSSSKVNTLADTPAIFVKMEIAIAAQKQRFYKTVLR